MRLITPSRPHQVPEGVSLHRRGNLSAGGSQTFTTAPSGGYQVSSLVVDGSNLGPLTAYTFTDVKANHTISVSFMLSSGSWSFCANEGSLCNFSGTQNVRYGANGVYVTKSLTNGTMCTNSVFGDPINGVAKQCFVQLPEISPLLLLRQPGNRSPSGSVQVASGGTQTFNVAPASGYQVSSVLVDGTDRGALTTYSFTNVTANHTINASFTPSSSGSWTFCANEGGLCGFLAAAEMYVTERVEFMSRSLSRMGRCAPIASSEDPINGVAKQCYVSAGTVVFAVNSGGPTSTLSRMERISNPTEITSGGQLGPPPRQFRELQMAPFINRKGTGTSPIPFLCPTETIQYGSDSPKYTCLLRASESLTSS